MFVLEESELFEDKIKDKTVLRLYNVLKNNETSSSRHVYVEEILADEKVQKLTEALFEQAKIIQNDGTITLETKTKYPFEFVEKLSTDLNICIEDVAALSLVIQATLIQLFVIDNFTGPSIHPDLYDKRLPQIFAKLQSTITFEFLTSDESQAYHINKNPWMLQTIQALLNLLDSLKKSRLQLDLEYLVWRSRYWNLHNLILLEPSETIIKELRKVQNYIFDHHIICTDKPNNTQLVRFDVVELCCELVQSALLRDDITFSRKVLDYAFDYSGVSIEQTGLLGKRTKFQQNNIPQLVIKISQSSDGVIPKPHDDTNLPHDVELVDDTLLPEISLELGNDEGDSKKKVSTQAQALLLTKLNVALRTEVTEESLQDELTQAYLRSVIKSTNIWTIKFKALAMRSDIEKKFSRKVERSFLQMEELIKIVRENQKANLSELRLKSFYSVLSPSSWSLQRQLGDISFSLGLHKNALETFSQIEYWEGMIKCFSSLGHNSKAESLIRQELAKKETPYLYCLLGDVTEDIVHYEKSWTLSNKRFTRAKKSIGNYFYLKKDYEQAIENYEEALIVNSSNVSVLSMLAYSCMILERYERAAQCYRTITYFDDTNFLAWNNLSKCYIKLDQKERAWRTLKEAIKCNFDEWKIWENFLLVSIEIGALDDVLVAWHRIIDLKGSHKDDTILDILTRAIISKDLKELDSDYKKLIRDATRLLARLNTTTECSPRSWACYAKLLLKEYEVVKLEAKSGHDIDRVEVDARVSKILNALQRATPTALTASSDWYKVPAKIIQVLDSFLKLADCYNEAGLVLGKNDDLFKKWQYCKLSIKNALQVLNKQGYI